MSAYCRPQTKLRKGNVLHLSDSVHRGVSVQGVFVQGGSLSKGVSVQEVSVQWGSLSNGGLCPVGGLCQGDPHIVKSGQYASYWNAF